MPSIDPRVTLAKATEELVGPWPCERCGQMSQFAVIKASINRVFCRNESCRLERIIDKRRCIVIEPDGTHWEYDNRGNKRRITGQ